MSVNNIIHIIRFTPPVYQVPYMLTNDFLVTEDDINVITEDGDKIRL
jgi:hypothetical protein